MENQGSALNLSQAIWPLLVEGAIVDKESLVNAMPKEFDAIFYVAGSMMFFSKCATTPKAEIKLGKATEATIPK